MKRKKYTNIISAWSFSRYSVYRKCPALFKYKYIDKLKEPDSEALRRGIAIHSKAEMFLKGRAKTLPAELKSLKNDFTKLRKAGAYAEEQWTLTADWKETGWFEKDAWLRIKVDADYMPESRTLTVIDFKTGKIRLGEGYEEQLELYGVGGFSIYDVDTIKTELWYVDHGKIYGRGDNDDENEEDFIYRIDDHQDLLKSWERRVAPMFNDKRFAPTPNHDCQWCHFSKSKGGPCKY